MKGKFNILVENNWISYQLEIKRKFKFTVIRGDSASGKSYFCNLINSGDSVRIECSVPIVVVQNRDMLEYYLEGSDRIIVFDEDSYLFKNISLYSKKLISSNNYFIILSRSFLIGVPYSLKEIYKFSSRIVNNKTINSLTPIYNFSTKVDNLNGIVITEDTKSGNINGVSNEIFYNE